MKLKSEINSPAQGNQCGLNLQEKDFQDEVALLGAVFRTLSGGGGEQLCMGLAGGRRTVPHSSRASGGKFRVCCPTGHGKQLSTF